MHQLLSGLTFPEQPRWHEGRLWFSDWGTRSLIAVDPTGESELVLRGQSFPMCVDWLPDGRLVLGSGGEGLILCRQDDGTLGRYADLNHLSDHPPGNEIVVDDRGRVYMNGGGFDLMAGRAFAPGMIALVEAPGVARVVAGELAFPNGMLITPDGTTLIVAESYGKRLTAFDIAADGSLVGRRVWADLGDGVPDGICMDVEGAVWYADVPNACCVRVREGGEVLETVDVDRGCFACALGGADRSTLFITANRWDRPGSMFERTEGVLLALPAPAPGAGWP